MTPDGRRDDQRRLPGEGGVAAKVLELALREANDLGDGSVEILMTS